MKKPKKGCCVIKGETWPFATMVCIGVTREELFAWAEKKYDKPFTKEDKEKIIMTGKGRTVLTSGRCLVLWLNEWPETPEQHGVLAHEIFHTCDLMLYQTGMRLCDSSDEAWAYHIEWMTKMIYGAFKLVK